MLQTPPVSARDDEPGAGPPPADGRRRLWLVAGMAALLGAIVLGAVLTASPSSTRHSALGSNPNLDPGTALNRPAPNFTLTDQAGRRLSLRPFRGKVVMLAFN